MSEFPSENSEKRSEAAPMTTAEQAARLMHEIAEPRPVGDTVKSAINRAAKRVSRFLSQPLSYSRAEDIWRREARRLRVEEMDAIRAAHQARARGICAESSLAADLADQLDRLVALCEAKGLGVVPDQIRESARAARQSARALGRHADARSEV